VPAEHAKQTRSAVVEQPWIRWPKLQAVVLQELPQAVWMPPLTSVAVGWKDPERHGVHTMLDVVVPADA